MSSTAPSSRFFRIRASIRSTGRAASLLSSTLLALPFLLLSTSAAMAAGGPPAVDDGCAQIVTPAVVDQLKHQDVDPQAQFEAWRVAKHIEMEMPPPVRCMHIAWAKLHGKSAGEEEGEIETKSSMATGLKAASLGGDLDLAPTGVPTYQGEVQVAVDPNNPMHMVAGSNSFYRDPAPQCQSPTGGASKTYGTQALFGSSDGGATWVYQCAPWPAADTGGLGGAQYWFGSDPTVAFDSQGNAYANYMLINQTALGSTGSSLVVSRSTDNGQTWSALSIIANTLSNSTTFDDKNMMAIDTTSGQAHSHTDRIFVIWDRNNSERVAYSDPPYSSWTTVVLSGSGDIGGQMTIGRDGTVYAIWNKYSQTGGVGSGDRTVFSKSTNGGATWSAAVQVGRNHNLASFGTNNKPPMQDQRGVNAFASISIDNNPSSIFVDRLYVVYPDFPSTTGSGSNINIYENYSTDGGATWSSEVKVNDDTGTATQIFPWGQVDQSDGTLNVGWYDGRNDGGNTRSQMYYARSIDGGVSFEPNINVVDAGTNFVNKVGYSQENSGTNANYNGNQYGDYTGIAAANRQAHAIWTDTRNYYPTSGDTRVEDAATLTITNCSAPAAIAAPILACNAGSIDISWLAPSNWGTNATNGTYSIERFTDASCTTGKVVVATALTATGYTDSSVAAGTTYYYHVIAKNNCPGTALTPMSTTSACSSAVACAACTPPGVPTVGTVVANAPSSLTVSWTAGSPAGATYTVYRADGACPGSSYSAVATGITATSWTDNTVVGGNTYSYEISAVDAGGSCESSLSSCASGIAYGDCMTAPTFPGLTSATGSVSSTCTIDLSWSAGTANCSGPLSYSVYRSATSGFTPSSTNRIATRLSGTSYSDTSALAANTTYYYIVRAMDESNNVEETNTVQKSATTGAGCTSAPFAVQAFTVTTTGTASGGENLLEWWDPPAGSSGTTVTINYRTDQYPSSPADPSATTLVTNRPVVFGAVDTYTHTGLTNGVTYYYAIWVRY
ncbi:MAG: hypothetical protein WBX15_18700 [Thermoanaerobaculia bacterium]